jgi:predicted class III extradiol MEMO1 family dioxygenase
VNTVRQPAVAGLFYPDSAQELSRDIKHYLQKATLVMPVDFPHPKAIIAPHAGYRYSGLTAAHAYASIIKQAKTINRVVLLGLLRAAKSRNMSVHTLALTNSGDSSGEHGSVVGYGSWALKNK